MEGHYGIGMLEIADIYYNTSTPSTDLQQLARDFFKSIDYDGDGKVSLSEFLNFMKEKGFKNMGNRSLFDALDVNRNGSLEFMQVMASYYIIKSGRPFCGGCGNFIPGIFFSCSICFDNEDDAFSVCPKCFRNGNYIHNHKPIHFLDNFALLEAKRKKAMATRKAPPPNRRKKKSIMKNAILHPRTTIASGFTSESASASTSTSDASVPCKSEQKEWMWQVALLDAGLNMIGGAVSSAAGAVGGATVVAAICNIM